MVRSLLVVFVVVFVCAWEQCAIPNLLESDIDILTHPLMYRNSAGKRSRSPSHSSRDRLRDNRPIHPHGDHPAFNGSTETYRFTDRGSTPFRQPELVLRPPPSPSERTSAERPPLSPAQKEEITARNLSFHRGAVANQPSAPRPTITPSQSRAPTHYARKKLIFKDQK